MNEPTRYVWLRDGTLVTGTLGTYAKMWEHDYYTGEQTLTGEILTWDGNNPPVAHKVSVQRHKTTDDYILYELTTNGEQALVMIDGRA